MGRNKKALLRKNRRQWWASTSSAGLLLGSDGHCSAIQSGHDALQQSVHIAFAFNRKGGAAETCRTLVRIGDRHQWMQAAHGCSGCTGGLQNAKGSVVSLL